MSSPAFDPLDVECPACASPPSFDCRSLVNPGDKRIPHLDRISAARAAWLARTLNGEPPAD